ncbi:isocitrate lyase/PEP mutase family protein [Occallatibacter riparius]|uniref:Isocitrate lyase/phosphoenolpyruvate mutase family protein n=1 Tax=Occallatibacter riparius TaxID=1002689 RepID=A0A9J7BYP8_9BACT|nr:isocitrate lyase/phosphoenolpyruvate mutase family protein [Occallatibacter riparius]UWZ86661.1 isocitrate lyase/phosphoenolpyruvate mutase family protein [Occallatibacter riparius]
MVTQAVKAERFRALHERDRAFIIPNPWDAGTARMLAQLGFEALATTSAGYAFSRGTVDGAVGRDAMMAHVADLVAATDLPVSADLENGFGDSPETVAETIRMGAGQGLAGGSIEDATGNEADPIYRLEQARERIQAAAEAVRALPFTFTLTARAENFLHGRPDLKDTILRLQAYQEAGADVLYAPGLTSREDIAAVVGSVDRPVNVLAGMPAMRLSAAELSAIGVKRISTGSALARAALGGFLLSAKEMAIHGTFGFVEGAAANSKDVVPLLESWRKSSGQN